MSKTYREMQKDIEHPGQARIDFGWSHMGESEDSKHVATAELIETLEGIKARQTSSYNNGGSTDYYKLKPEWKDLQDIIEDRQLNFSQGNILKVAYTFNVGRHDGTDYERELNKIIWFANRELQRIHKDKS